MQLTPRYAAPADAWDDFLAFAGQARTVAGAHPDWREWATSPAVANPSARRGAGKWRQDWLEMAGSGLLDRDCALAALRRLRRREYLRLGLLDFGGFLPLEDTMHALAGLADFCLAIVLEIETVELDRRFPRPASPFSILAMGKLGGQELNYSSDIDVIFIYGDDGELKANLTYHEYFTRLAQRLVRAFSTQTEDGSLFRIDLRLRPEGDAGPLVCSLGSCEHYYAGYAETWERMALLKARLAAGSEELEYDFEQMRLAFCFPRSLSADVLEEIGHIKQRIERDVVGQDNLDVHVKLGTGGIREVEFIVQALQILNGARLPYVQHRGTLRALEAIQTLELLPPAKVRALEEAYRFWRLVEHRLQMRADLQTHTLPRDAAGRAVIAASLGLEPAEFEARIELHRRCVNEIFQGIFSGHAPVRPLDPPDLGFFRDPAAAGKNLEALRPGRGASTHTAARTLQGYELLTVELLARLRGLVDPDVALVRFVRFAEAYGARSLLFESLVQNPRALELMLRIFDRSVFYTNLLVSRPELFEEAARAGTLDTAKEVRDFLAEMQALHGDPREEARRYRRGELLRIFLRDVLGLAQIPELEGEYSDLAEACLRYAVGHAASGSGIIVFGMGKFGGREIAYGSDLDCLMVGENVAAGQELNRFMTEVRASGILFPMDFRLRPNGEGPICVPRETYVEYYRTKAQAWEIQALTRARFVAGSESLGREIEREWEAIWLERIRSLDMPREIAKMRRRIENERGNPAFPQGDFKTGAGGLIDVEFGVQKHLAALGRREPSTLKGIEILREAHPKVAEAWRQGYLFLRRVESVLRSENNSAISAIPQADAAQENLARHLGFPDREAFWARCQSEYAAIRQGYLEVMGDALPLS